MAEQKLCPHMTGSCDLCNEFRVSLFKRTRLFEKALQKIAGLIEGPGLAGDKEVEVLKIAKETFEEAKPKDLEEPEQEANTNDTVSDS